MSSFDREDRVRLHMNDVSAELSFRLGSPSLIDPRAMSRSALQNPDISRAELERMMRVDQPHPTTRSWGRLMAAAASKCANGNNLQA